MAVHTGWDKNTPSNTSSAGLGDDDMRSIKSYMQEWWQQDHYGTDGSASSAGVHKLGSARVFSAAVSSLSTKGDDGWLYWSNDAEQLSILRVASIRTIPSIGTTNSWSAAQTFTSGLTVSAGTTAVQALTATTGSFSSTLGVTGAVTLSSTLVVTGAATLSSTLAVTGASTLTGRVGIGNAATSSAALYHDASAAIVSGTNQYGAYFDLTTGSDATSEGAAFYARITTPATVFTMAEAIGLRVDSPSKGAGSIITSAYGAKINAMTAGGANNYGVYVNTPSGASTLNDAIHVVGGRTYLGGAVVAASTLDVTGITTLDNYLQGTTGDGLIKLRGDSGATVDLTLTDAGLLLLGDTANANMTVGLTINQGANDDEAYAAKSSDVAHAFTPAAETDTYWTLGKVDAAGGGVLMRALAEDAAITNIFRVAAYGGTADTTKSTAGRALAEIYGSEHDGLGAQANITADGNVFGVRARVGAADVMRWLVDEDGDTWQAGGITATTGTFSSTLIASSTIELGHATDTTLARVSAGVVSIEGVTVATASNTLTLTGKSIAASQITAGTFTAGTFSFSGSTITTLGTVSAATSITSTAFVGPLTGNASTATALQTARTIGGTSFDGTANITVASATGGFTVTGEALEVNFVDAVGSIQIDTSPAVASQGLSVDMAPSGTGTQVGVDVILKASGSYTGTLRMMKTNAQLLAGGTQSVSTLVHLEMFSPTVNAGSITTQYGLYVQALAEATTNYAIYTNTGLVRLGDNLALFANGSFGGGDKVVFIANATTVPSSNPTGGGVLYVEAGALKYRGSSGTVTVIAAA